MMIFNPRRNEGHLWEIRAVPAGVFGSTGGSLDDRSYFYVVLVRRGSAQLERVMPIQPHYASRRPAPPRGGPRWFSTFDLDYGTRIDHPNRQIVPLREFTHDEGCSWMTSLSELKAYADNDDAPLRSPVIILEDDRALGPPHTSHALIRAHGGGSYSHWEGNLFLSTPDDSNPNTNDRSYVAIVPPAPTF
jgi:hypothetical protein